MKIKVLGSGCANCKRLYSLACQAIKELGIDAEIEYITDIQKIIEKGFMQTPILTIDDKPVIMGYVPDLKTIKNKIAETGEK
ncbi:MAG: thioredoxin family protein [Candidatus Humimicrobiaceae bacterium]